MGKRKRLDVKPRDTVERDLRKQIADMEGELQRLQESHERQMAAKFKIPKGSRATPKGSFIRLVVPDTHGAHVDKAAFRAMVNDAKHFKPREVVLLGDNVSCDGWLAEHHTPNYVSQLDYSYEEDLVAGNVQLDELQAACPTARFWYIEGNHERRVELWCSNTAKRSKRDVDFLMRATAPRHQLSLEKRGIEYIHSLDQRFADGNTRGSLMLGKCLFLHGYKHGKAAVKDTLDDLAKNFVMGHIHRRQSFTRTTHDSEIAGWCPGCLCELRQFYNHTKPTHHAHGYGLQICKPDGDFLHINTPIIDGKSYLSTISP